MIIEATNVYIREPLLSRKGGSLPSCPGKYFRLLHLFLWSNYQTSPQPKAFLIYGDFFALYKDSTGYLQNSQIKKWHTYCSVIQGRIKINQTGISPNSPRAW